MGQKHSGWANVRSGSRANSSQPIRSRGDSAIKSPRPTGYTSDDYSRLFALLDSGQSVDAFLETLPQTATPDE